MDHAATTAVDPAVLDAMLPHLREAFGNPSSSHRLGTAARVSMDDARATVAGILGAKPGEILFTSGGTESDNLALRGVALARRGRGRHIITSSIEHHAIGHTCEQLVNRQGFHVTYIAPDRSGLIEPDDVGRAITNQTTLISIAYANNEVGTIEPIAEIAKIARVHGIAFHTDAVQAAGNLDLDVGKLNVDLLSLSGHKFHGPKGVGVLYVREGVQLLPTQTGGSQEHGLRAGTENVPGIVGFAAALRLAHERKAGEVPRLTALRNLLINGVTSSIDKAYLTGHATRRLANNASFVFEGVTGSDLVMELDEAGVAASSGSACTSCNPTPSHVLMAMGYGSDLGRGALRLTLGIENREEDVCYVLEVLPGIVASLRASRSVIPRVAASEAAGTLPRNRVASSAWDEGRHHSGHMAPSAGISASICPSPASLVYALGELGYDFGTETRRDSFIQQVGSDVLKPERMLAHLEAAPASATTLIWTLSADGVPLYAVAPQGPYAEAAYERLREYLLAQLSETAERVSMPGIVGGSVTLLNGQVVPVIVPELRGMFAWSTQSLVNSVLGSGRDKTDNDDSGREQTAEDVANLLDRIYYEARNPGLSPRDRAVNYAATNAYQIGRVYMDSVKSGRKLDAIDVERSPICRPGSDCWDVKLTFFHPAQRLQQARMVYRFTVDVSDVVPVTVGNMRNWEIY
jgi:cysteine desulfurase